jgi:hypothetical protein
VRSTPPPKLAASLPDGGVPGVTVGVRLAVALGGLISCGACVDSSRTTASEGDAAASSPGIATCEVPSPVPYSGAASIPSQDTSAPGPYLWKNVVISGGGFVSGIVTSPVLPGLVFARTDVGGAYRYDPAGQRWVPLTDWVGHDNSNLIGIESIAADPVDPNRVYLAAGTYVTAGNGAILSSTDMGQTWTRNNIAAPMGGNADGRSMGERLAVDPNLTSILYFGSRTSGLWRSADSALTWSQVGAFPTGGASIVDAGTGYGLAFVLFDPRSGSPGSATPAIYVGVGVTEGTALFRTVDAGATWEAVAGQPANVMPHHAVLDGCGNVYFAYNNGPGPNNITKGEIWRYTTATGTWTQVSPPSPQGGFGGISADVAHPGTLMVTTIDYWSPGEIYRTTNGGATWTPLLRAAKRDVAGANWLWWHTAALPAMGWMGDVEIDPFDSGRVLFITGQGIWSSDDITAADSGAPTHWTFDDNGLEETVALDLISPPTGAPLISGVGDIGGFRHDDLDVSPPEGMSDKPVFGNTNGLDFAGAAPNVVARVGTSSQGGGARGAYSTDGGSTWTPFTAAFAMTSQSGTIAVSADGQRFLWAPQGGTPSYSLDAGATWTACGGLSLGVRVAADRVNPSKFYASGRNQTYLSIDGGETFAPAATAASARPRPVPGIEGDVWLATNAGLLHSQDSAATFVRAPHVNGTTAVGFGMPAPGQSYPAVYLAGSVDGVWGTYRSDDAGATWQRIDDPNHQFGYINCLTGDPRRYGRVYLGTGGRGILYGDPR